VALHKKTQITIETDQVLIIRRRQVGKAWCCACEARVDVVRTEQTRGLLQRTKATAEQARAVHFCDDSDGSALICLHSLLRSSQDDERK